MKKLLYLILLLTVAMNASAQADGDVLVDMQTTMGDVRLRLFAKTPLHRDNFVKLVGEGYYNGVLFHRVINDFMIQTGDSTTRRAQPGEEVGEGDANYTVPAEFVYPELFHKRGAVAAARQGDNVNPERRSSGAQFYIVTGRTFTPAQLDQMEYGMAQQQMEDILRRKAREHVDEIRALSDANDTEGLEALQKRLVAETEAEYALNPIRFTDEQREAYTTVGGTPHLDGTYTVFGEVVSGMEVVDAIQKVPTNAADRPLEDVRIISMKVVK